MVVVDEREPIFVPEKDKEITHDSSTEKTSSETTTMPKKISLAVKSHLARNYGDLLRVEVNADDLVADVIRRTCMVMNVQNEPRMYLRLDEDGTEVAGNDLVQDYLRAGMNVTLETRRVSPIRWTSAISALLAGVILLIVSNVLYHSTVDVPSSSVQHAVVIDAGSSHTSMVLYQWSPDENVGTTALVRELHECTATCPDCPGSIGEYVDDPAKVRPYLMSCLDDVGEQLSADLLKKTRIFLGATAGMRLLELDDPEGAKRLMDEVIATLEESQFLYEAGDASILTGQEEGAYAWISTNVINGAILPDTAGTSGEKKTSGALDMGGGSEQISFECKGEQTCGVEHVPPKHYNLYDKDYDVLASSQLCYGLQEAMRRYVATLIYDDFKEKRSIPQSVNNPCMYGDDGSQATSRDSWLVSFFANKSDIFDSPCTEPADPAFKAALDTLDPGHKFSHVGGYDKTKCEAKLASLLNPASCSAAFAKGDCFDPSVHPKPKGHFLAMSSYYWELRLLLNDAKTYAEVTTGIEQRCHTSPAILADECDICSDTDCFETSYIFYVLTQGFHFDDEESFNQIDFVENVNGTSVSWSLGFMVQASNDLKDDNNGDVERPSKKEPKISALVYGMMMAFGILLMLLASAALFVFHRQHNNRQLNRLLPN